MQLPHINKNLLAHVIIGSMFTTSVAGAWDIWWHMLKIRDTFWEPPHMLLYGSVTLTIFLGIYGWYITRQKFWRHLAAILVFVPLAAPFDNWWHEYFGVEKLTSPMLIWSPPHLVLVAALGISYMMLLRFIRRDKDIILHEFFGCLCLAGLMSLGYFVIAPFVPFENLHLVGFWGASFVAALFAYVLIKGQKVVPSSLTATYVAMIFYILTSLNLHEQVSSRLIIQPHPHLPNWLYAFALIAPAIALDILRKKSPLFRGCIFGIAYGLIFYGAAGGFFVEPSFIYTINDHIVAISSSIGGSLIAGLFASL